jgi:hypothetical protein
MQTYEINEFYFDVLILLAIIGLFVIALSVGYAIQELYKSVKERFGR